MKIVADENVVFAREAFSTLGEVIFIPGRAMTRDNLKDASILVVRSVTKVNADLLDNTSVQFVGTVTAGTDHIDQDFLSKKGIGFTPAKGANANSVAEYIVTALLMMAIRMNLSLEKSSLGIVGVGNIGRLVQQKAQALGMDVLVNDPPLRRETNDSQYRPLEDLLDADFLSLHVPLTHHGADRTFHLLDEHRIRQISPRTVVMNTSRGEVVDNKALFNAVTQKKLRPPILDVWEGEPNIHWGLLREAALGTPHVAGYSFDGKVQGTFQVYQDACRFFGRESTWNPRNHLPIPAVPLLKLQSAGPDLQELMYRVATQVHDLPGDHARMLEILSLPPENRPSQFDQLRKHYPIRREFHQTTVDVPNKQAELGKTLDKLGFNVV